MEHARKTLQKLMGQVLGDGPDAILHAWPAVCGARIAERTAAFAFERGVLKVRVPDKGWRNELERFAADYREQLSRMTGTHVHDIEFILENR